MNILSQIFWILCLPIVIVLLILLAIIRQLDK